MYFDGGTCLGRPRRWDHGIERGISRIVPLLVKVAKVLKEGLGSISGANGAAHRLHVVLLLPGLDLLLFPDGKLPGKQQLRKRLLSLMDVKGPFCRGRAIPACWSRGGPRASKSRYDTPYPWLSREDQRPAWQLMDLISSDADIHLLHLCQHGLTQRRSWRRCNKKDASAGLALLLNAMIQHFGTEGDLTQGLQQLLQVNTRPNSRSLSQPAEHMAYSLSS